MPKYVKPWNVGGAMKANAYYGAKLMTRRKRRRRKTVYREPNGFELFLANLVSAFFKGLLVLFAIIFICMWLMLY